MTMFDVRLLQTLAAVADANSFGRAAETLHATQPGVSQQIARLEHHFGVRLFTRGTRPAELTAAGEQIAARGRDILAAVARLESDAHAWASGKAGALALGLSSSVSASSIPPRIREFQEEQPQYSLTVDVASADVLFERLEAGVLDAVLTTLPPHGTAYLDITITVQQLGVALPSGHPAATRKSLTITDLLNEQFIVVPRTRHAEIYDHLVAVFTASGRTLTIAAEEVAFPSILARVGMGEGVGLVPVELPTSPGSGTVIVPLTAGPSLPVRFLTRHGAASPAVAALLAHLREEREPSATPKSRAHGWASSHLGS
jgi:DNA-binding transcriptional LysR family regulator